MPMIIAITKNLTGRPGALALHHDIVARLQAIARRLGHHNSTYSTSVYVGRQVPALAWTTARHVADQRGVPGNLPDPLLISALAQTSSSGSFGYCASEGELSLRQAIAKEMRVLYGDGTDVEIEAEDMSLTSGCNMAFVATIMTLADAGDEVILPLPWYFNHQMMLSMLGITAVPLETRPEDGFLPSTGATYPPALLSSFSALAREKGVALIIDETYRDFISPSRPPHSLFSSSDWRTHLIHLFSFSKSYAVPGHRLGLIVASPVFQQSLGKVLDTMQICAPRPIQLALAPLLAAGALRPTIQHTAEVINARHQLFRAHLPLEWKVGSSGGYFAFVRHPFVGSGSVEVCERLAREMGVLLLPGAFFRDVDVGASDDVEEDRWIRFSVANCQEDGILGVCKRLAVCAEEFGWAVHGHAVAD
ncbi:pyridoxal phosphate-dependent transferase [Mycena amicta]|nr:pyridoxal phosphate-dependent transferase [Mycena amicta]